MKGTAEETAPLKGSSGDGGKPFYFAPRSNSLSMEKSEPKSQFNGDNPKIVNIPPSQGGGGWGWWPFGSRQNYHPLGSKPRKVPVKVEPKVFFANERTFLAWLNMSVTLSSIAVAILAFADHNEFSQIYGFIVLPVAIAFCVYALRTYIRRASMIRNRDPGPYEDKFGPVALTVLLVLSILVNFLLKMYDIIQR